jgi:uncharacterized protein (TIGR00730 family)
MKNICVFCGSNTGASALYRHAADELGRLLVAQGLGLVYGGGSIGLMGVIADAVLTAGGHVTGVIPQQLATVELLNAAVTDMRIVPSMHTRKALMAELSDGFIALPGGYGTFEELFEIITWAQLGIHSKPIGLLNTEGYYDQLLAFIDRTIHDGFIKAQHRELFVVESTPERLLERLRTHQMPVTRKWIAPEQS